MRLSLPKIELRLDAGKRYAGIHITPIVAKAGKNAVVQKFLWEGIDNKSVEIQEHKTQSVPTVTVINRSKETFLGYRGSIIRGGGQNRQLVHSFVLPEGATLDIPVQCIQHGRWNPHQSKEFSSKAGDITSSTLRFQKKSQHETWRTIDETSTLSGTTSHTQDYTVVHDYLLGSADEMKHATSQISGTDRASDSKRSKSRERAQQIAKDFAEPIVEQVGLYVTMVDPFDWKEGKVRLIHSIELFTAPELYRKVHKDLIASFAMDAALLQNDEVSAHFYEDKMPDKLQTDTFDGLVKQVLDSPWKKQEKIGSEARHELTAADNFGEMVSSGEELLHLMYASYVS